MQHLEPKNREGFLDRVTARPEERDAKAKAAATTLGMTVGCWFRRFHQDIVRLRRLRDLLYSGRDLLKANGDFRAREERYEKQSLPTTSVGMPRRG